MLKEYSTSDMQQQPCFMSSLRKVVKYHFISKEKPWNLECSLTAYWGSLKYTRVPGLEGHVIMKGQGLRCSQNSHPHFHKSFTVAFKIYTLY